MSLDITYEAFRKMLIASQIVADKHNCEVMGLLVAEEGKNKHGLTVTDIIIPEQTIEPMECKLDIGKTLSEKNIPRELVPKIRGWFHSHKTIGCFYSGEDDKTLENWASIGNYAIGIVVSLPDNVKAYIQHGKPILTDKQEVNVNILFPEIDNKMREALETDLAQKLTVKKQTAKGKTVRTVSELVEAFYTPTTKDRYPFNYVDHEDKPEGVPIEQLDPVTTEWFCDHLIDKDVSNVFCNKDDVITPPHCAECDFKPPIPFNDIIERINPEVTTETVTKTIQQTKPKLNTEGKEYRLKVWLQCDHLRILTKNNKIREWKKAKRKEKKQALKSKALICSYRNNIPDCEVCGFFLNRNKEDQQDQQVGVCEVKGCKQSATVFFTNHQLCFNHYKQHNQQPTTHIKDNKLPQFSYWLRCPYLTQTRMCELISGKPQKPNCWDCRVYLNYVATQAEERVLS